MFQGKKSGTFIFFINRTHTHTHSSSKDSTGYQDNEHLGRRFRQWWGWWQEKASCRHVCRFHDGRRRRRRVLRDVGRERGITEVGRPREDLGQRESTGVAPCPLLHSHRSRSIQTRVSASPSPSLFQLFTSVLITVACVQELYVSCTHHQFY